MTLPINKERNLKLKGMTFQDLEVGKVPDLNYKGITQAEKSRKNQRKRGVNVKPNKLIKNQRIFQVRKVIELSTLLDSLIARLEPLPN
jgi:hypothetical protein